VTARKISRECVHTVALFALAFAAVAVLLPAHTNGAAAQKTPNGDQSRPAWFVQGLQEYTRVSSLQQSERQRQRTTLLRWAKQHRQVFSCCTTGLQIQDAPRAGAVFLTFLAQQFGDYVLGELQSDKVTFDDALANQTKPYELSLLFERFTAWLSSTSAFDRPQDQFITVNSVRLQHVDWGGRGDVLLFLPGLGDNVHRFDPFAPYFADHWHVVGYSRRGQGQSDQPASGYDTNTLVEDLRAFLDANHIDTVDLIGHSMAGTEMTVFATRYSSRVHHVVYLDAAYDFAAGRDVAEKAGLSARPGPSPIEQLNYEYGRNHLDFTKVRVPALAFFVLYDRPEDPPGIRPEFKLRPELLPYLREQVAVFRRDAVRGEAIELRNTDHLFFNDPRIQSSVVKRIQTFLRRR
jgi:pimeloyl-ACP methyl ester carboxylesterase